MLHTDLSLATLPQHFKTFPDGPWHTDPSVPWYTSEHFLVDPGTLILVFPGTLQSVPWWTLVDYLKEEKIRRGR